MPCFFLMLLMFVVDILEPPKLILIRIKYNLLAYLSGQMYFLRFSEPIISHHNGKYIKRRVKKAKCIMASILYIHQKHYYDGPDKPENVLCLTLKNKHLSEHHKTSIRSMFNIRCMFSSDGLLLLDNLINLIYLTNSSDTKVEERPVFTNNINLKHLAIQYFGEDPISLNIPINIKNQLTYFSFYTVVSNLITDDYISDFTNIAGLSVSRSNITGHIMNKLPKLKSLSIQNSHSFKWSDVLDKTRFTSLWIYNCECSEGAYFGRFRADVF